MVWHPLKGTLVRHIEVPGVPQASVDLSGPGVSFTIHLHWCRLSEQRAFVLWAYQQLSGFYQKLNQKELHAQGVCNIYTLLVWTPLTSSWASAL